MSAPHRRRIDVMLDEGYLDDLAAKPIEAVRSMHDECMEVETEISYVRRLAQARIDIVSAELERRDRGGSVEELVARLPSILADPAPRADPAHSRLPQHLAPSMDITWRRGLEHLITDATLVNLPTIGDDELRETVEQLHTLEREMSERRRALHSVIDRIELELAERYRVGRV
ncbi:MAG TPA: aerial mycelium formation protein [Acidimicrobiia bacterium]|nr:aerial mycelium formation protein [Acidimicrobiia bacterium]HWW44543.1 aerial mycelium formation protein [Acidimicrobiia bacterium]